MQLSSDYQAHNSCLRLRPNPLTTWSSLLHKQPRPCFPLHPSLVSFIRPLRLISLKMWPPRLHRIILVLSSSTLPISQYLIRLSSLLPDQTNPAHDLVIIEAPGRTHPPHPHQHPLPHPPHDLAGSPSAPRESWCFPPSDGSQDLRREQGWVG